MFLKKIWIVLLGVIFFLSDCYCSDENSLEDTSWSQKCIKKYSLLEKKYQDCCFTYREQDPLPRDVVDRCCNDSSFLRFLAQSFCFLKIPDSRDYYNASLLKLAFLEHQYTEKVDAFKSFFCQEVAVCCFANLNPSFFNCAMCLWGSNTLCCLCQIHQGCKHRVAVDRRLDQLVIEEKSCPDNSKSLILGVMDDAGDLILEKYKTKQSTIQMT